MQLLRMPHLPLLQIWDFPGQIDFFDPTFDSEHIFGGSGALIFVIDAQARIIVSITCSDGDSRQVTSLMPRPHPLREEKGLVTIE